MFENLSSAIKNEKLDERLKTSITEQRQSFEAEFKRYFAERKEQEGRFVQNPFSRISVLVCYAQILPTNIRTDFSNINSICHNIPRRERFFSSIKTKARNRKKVYDDIRLALSNSKPQISKSAVRLQSQPSH